MASIVRTTEADPTDSEVQHLNNQLNHHEQFTPSSGSEIASDNVSVYLINAGEMTTCPRVRVTFGNSGFNVIIDTGSQVSVLSEEIYRKLKLQGESIQELPVQSVVLVSAFGNKTARVRRQALIPFRITDEEFENNFLICPQLVNPGLLGADFLCAYKFTIDLGAGCMARTVPGEAPRIVKFSFVSDYEPFKNDDIVTPTDGDEDEVCIQRVTFDGKVLIRPTVVRASPGYWTRRRYPGLSYEEKRQVEEEYGAHGYPENTGEDTVYYDDEIEDEGEEHDYEAPCDDDLEEDHGNKGPSPENASMDGKRGEQKPRCSSGNEDVINRTLGTLEMLDQDQMVEVEEILRKYHRSFSSIPGRCVDYEYGFEVEDHVPFTAKERPIPYMMREAVREQIEMMIEHGIIEPASSPYSNPLVIVPKANKAPRICLDARRLNAVTIADAERTQPVQELLQQFEEVEFLSCLDLTAAFLQIPMKPACRKYTAFLFNSRQYQFCRMAYGLKNSGCALIRAMRRIFGPETYSYLCQYIDDLYIHSKSYELHKQHIDFVIRKLTENGLTINLSKCKFFKKSIKFLGHVIDSKGVSPDPDRIASIQTYPAPNNQKQLRQFLGTVNFHHRFIIGYGEYIAPLLPLLKKGVKWKWTGDHEEAFVRLRRAFAASIHLSHPRNDLPYVVYTDASCYAISGILMQVDEEGRTSIISTASRVLLPPERRYTTCEQELLAVVYALQKFRLYVYGSKIKLHTDNKSLSFLKRCAITSNRVARWMVLIQEYDLDIVHIAGCKNHFADTLSRHPAGLNTEQVNALRRPREIMVATIDLGLDPSIKRDMRNLAILQEGDPEYSRVFLDR
jgi:hypothetical protein